MGVRGAPGLLSLFILGWLHLHLQSNLFLELPSTQILPVYLQYFNLPLQLPPLLLLHILFLPSSPSLCTKWKNSFILLEFDLSFQALVAY